jgi:FdhE protein
LGGGKEDAERLGVSAELVGFVGRLLAAPFVRHVVLQRSPHESAASASEGTCPACGSTPGLASLRPDDGGRVLHCSLCGHAWPFGRLDCPFCTDSDESTLIRLEIPGDEARWIEACDRCRHYLKVIDRRRLTERHEFIPLVEEVAGLYLDLVAEGEGYLRKPPYASIG